MPHGVLTKDKFLFNERLKAQCFGIVWLVDQNYTHTQMTTWCFQSHILSDIFAANSSILKNLVSYRVGFNVPLDTLQVSLETIFPANHFTGAKSQSS